MNPRRVTLIAFASAMAGVAIGGEGARRLHHSPLRRFLDPPPPLLVARDAVVHPERFQRARRRAVERLHRAVAGLALHPGDDDVGAVREEDVRRQPPHALPGDLPDLLEGLNLLDLARGLSAAVAAQAERRPRATRDRFLLRAIVATRALEVQLDVGVVGERDRLRDLRRPPQPQHAPGERDDRERSDHGRPFHVATFPPLRGLPPPAIVRMARTNCPGLETRMGNPVKIVAASPFRLTATPITPSSNSRIAIPPLSSTTTTSGLRRFSPRTERSGRSISPTIRRALSRSKSFLIPWANSECSYTMHILTAGEDLCLTAAFTSECQSPASDSAPVVPIRAKPLTEKGLPRGSPFG